MGKNKISIEEKAYDENEELLRRYKNGDKKAMDKLIEANLPLVSALSKKFLNRGYDYEDIFQIGSLGLVKSVQNFNPDFKVRFSTYAVPMIMGEIRRFLRDDGMVKVSRSVKVLSNKIHFCREELLKTNNREPTIEEIASYCNIDKEEAVLAIESSSSMQYLYDTIHKEDGAAILLIDKISEKVNENEDVINRIALKEALNSLGEEARKIIILRYFKDKTQSQVAKLLGINQVQVSRIEKKILIAMREKLLDID